MSKKINIKYFIVSLAVAMVFLFAGIFEWDQMRQDFQREAQIDFDDRSKEITLAVKNKLNSYVYMLYGLEGLFNASDEVRRSEFSAYIKALDSDKHFPGLSIISFVRRVPARDADAFNQRIGTEFPMPGIFPADLKEDYYPIDYVYPESDINLRTVGYDISSDLNRRFAMEKAMNANEAVMTGQIPVKPDNEPGVVIISPVYQKNAPVEDPSLRRGAVLGYVQAVLHTQDFFSAVASEYDLKDIDLAVSDITRNGGSNEPETLFHFNNDQFADGKLRASAAGNSALTSVISIDMAGRTWSFIFFTPIAATQFSYQKTISAMVLLGSGLISLLVLILLYSLLASRQEALSLAREIENRYEALFKSSADAIMILEPPLWKFTGGNLATLKLFNVKDEKEFISLSPWDVSPKKQPDGSLSEPRARSMMEKAIKEGSNSFEWIHKKYKGDDFPAEVLLTKMRYGGKWMLQATVRDISRKKKIEAIKQDHAKELNRSKKELEVKVSELERWRKVMVGRELEMVELKKKIKQLSGLNK